MVFGCNKILGLKVRRIITEPTAAALAYGLHKKNEVEYITVVDFGILFDLYKNINLFFFKVPV